MNKSIEIVSFIYQILESLEYLNKIKITHLNFKPENILIDNK